MAAIISLIFGAKKANSRPQRSDQAAQHRPIVAPIAHACDPARAEPANIAGLRSVLAPGSQNLKLALDVRQFGLRPTEGIRSDDMHAERRASRLSRVFTPRSGRPSMASVPL